MKIRNANSSDIGQISDLYFETVTNVNKKDYSPEQIKVWSESAYKTEVWEKKISEQHFFLADDNGIIAGFGSVTGEGYVDYMYVNKDYQRRGVATLLMNAIDEVTEKYKPEKLWAHVSITARPFFKNRGFEITESFITKVGDVEFEDCVMTKKLI